MCIQASDGLCTCINLDFSSATLSFKALRSGLVIGLIFRCDRQAGKSNDGVLSCSEQQNSTTHMSMWAFVMAGRIRHPASTFVRNFSSKVVGCYLCLALVNIIMRQ